MSPLLQAVSGKAFGFGSATTTSTSFESIATVTGNGSGSTLSFTSIPSGYKHLQIRGIASDTDTAQNAAVTVGLRFNSDSLGNYSFHRITGAAGGTVTGSGQASYSTIFVYGASVSNSTSSFVGVSLIDIFDYGSTSKYKTIRYFTGADANIATNNYAIFTGSGLWMSTSAITQIDITDFGGTAYRTNTQFALYGIKEAA